MFIAIFCIVALGEGGRFLPPLEISREGEERGIL